MKRATITEAKNQLSALLARVRRGETVDELCESAVRFLRVHPLRSGDALQLAAAFTAAERRPSSLGFVCLDDRLALAAAGG